MTTAPKASKQSDTPLKKRGRRKETPQTKPPHLSSPRVCIPVAGSLAGGIRRLASDLHHRLLSQSFDASSFPDSLLLSPACRLLSSASPQHPSERKQQERCWKTDETNGSAGFYWSARWPWWRCKSYMAPSQSSLTQQDVNREDYGWSYPRAWKEKKSFCRASNKHNIISDCRISSCTSAHTESLCVHIWIHQSLHM